MKKTILLFLLIILCNGFVKAQIGIGTSSPNAKAALEVYSTSKGLLPPRLTYAEKNAITSPPAGLLLWCSNCGANGELQVYNGTEWVNMVGSTASNALPSLAITTTASSIAGTTATSGGNVTNDGGSTVSARGICWSNTSNPTTANSKTTESGTTGSFSSNLTGLNVSTTYYVRAYATNAVGTAYGSEISFTTSSISIGDPGYNAGVQHGLIATTADKAGAIWGCSGTSISTSEAIGSGNSNTTAIITTCTTAGIAAKLCADLVEGGNSDWYLPSRNELAKMYLNRALIGGFNGTFYQTSSQFNNENAWLRKFSIDYPGEYGGDKAIPYVYRPIHSF